MYYSYKDKHTVKYSVALYKHLARLFPCQNNVTKRQKVRSLVVINVRIMTVHSFARVIIANGLVQLR